MDQYQDDLFEEDEELSLGVHVPNPGHDKDDDLDYHYRNDFEKETKEDERALGRFYCTHSQEI